MRIFIDMDGTVAEIKPFISLDQFYQENYYLDLYPQQKLINALKTLGKKHELFILSKVVDSPYCIEEKNQWLDTYMPFVTENHRIFVEYNDSKINHIPSGIQSDDVLIDDYNGNLKEWKNAGGIAVKFINGRNSPDSFNGIHINEDLPEMFMYDEINNLKLTYTN